MKKSFLKSTMAMAISLGMTLPAISQNYNQTYQGQQTLLGKVTYVPVGTTLDAILTSPIDSSIAKPGDVFNARIVSPVYLGNDLALPANTILEGQVTAAEKGGHAGINGVISLRLIAAISPDGIRYPLSAKVVANQSDKTSPDKQGNLHGRSKKTTVATGVARTAAWTAGGTLLGIMFAPIVAGSVAAGAIAGVATGGAVGLGSNLWRKGKDVKIPSGTPMKFALDQPMSLTAGLAGAPVSVR